MRSSRLCGDNADPSDLARTRLLSNYDVDVLTERCQQVHQPFHREAGQLVVTQRRNLWLRDSQHLGSISLRKLTVFEHLVQRVRQPQLRLALDSIRISEILEYVGGSS